jgi:hypothetical protein
VTLEVFAPAQGEAAEGQGEAAEGQGDSTVGRMFLAWVSSFWLQILFAKLSGFFERGRLPRPKPAG